MTLTITVRFSAAPAAARCPDGDRPPAVSIRHRRAAPGTVPAAPDAAVAALAPATAGTTAAGTAAAGTAASAGDVPARRDGLAGAATLSSLLALAEPAALLAAEAAGLGLLGKVLLATAMRTAQRAIAS